MGCQVAKTLLPPSSSSVHLESRFDDIWKRIDSSIPSDHSAKLANHGCLILRVLLVSTYKDFHNERREILNMIQTIIQPNATKKGIFIQVEDFNYGSKAFIEDPTSVYMIARCVEETKKCSQFVYFHLLGECAGYTINNSFHDTNFLKKYKLMSGQSLNEVFLQLTSALHSANALFAKRVSSFLIEIPFNVTTFIDDPVNRKRANTLSDRIKKSVSSENFIEYHVTTSGINNKRMKQIQFNDLSQLLNPLYDHLMNNISLIPSRESYDINLYQRSFAEQFNSKYIQEIQVLIDKGKNIIIQGDYSSGKSVILRHLEMNNNNCFYIKLGHTVRSFKQLQVLIEKTVKVAVRDMEENIILLIDDYYMEDPSWVNSLGNMQYIISTNSHKPATFPSNFENFIIPNMSRDEVEKQLSIVKSAEKVLDPIRRRTSLGNIEMSEYQTNWNYYKCKLIAHMVDRGLSEQKCIQLSRLSVKRIIETELSLVEKDSRGHLLLAALSFLTVMPDGLTEIELRSLLSNEHALLPRNFTGQLIPYDFCSDVYGIHDQIPPLRWYYVVYRIEHLWTCIDPHLNLYQLPQICQMAIRKRYFKSNHLEHFEHQVRNNIKQLNWMLRR